MTRYAATIGNFDGVHLGHRHLLAQLRAMARAHGLQPLAVTFASHPLALIRPEAAPTPLLPIHLRLRALHSLGVHTLVLQFTPELRSLTALEFMTALHRHHAVDALLMGFNNRIGSDGPFTDADHRALGALAGISTVATAEPLADGAVSSSAIRQAIAEGRVEQAAEMLGRPYSVNGTVVHGHQLGRRIGFPTANLLTAPDTLLPAPGVYAAATSLGCGAVVNIGRRPTVAKAGEPPTVEAHLLDFSGDIYGKPLTLQFMARLRQERRFDGLEQLSHAIAADVTAARAIL